MFTFFSFSRSSYSSSPQSRNAFYAVCTHKIASFFQRIVKTFSLEPLGARFVVCAMNVLSRWVRGNIMRTVKYSNACSRLHRYYIFFVWELWKLKVFLRHGRQRKVLICSLSLLKRQQQSSSDCMENVEVFLLISWKSWRCKSKRCSNELNSWKSASWKQEMSIDIGSRLYGVLHLQCCECRRVNLERFAAAVLKMSRTFCHIRLSSLFSLSHATTLGPTTATTYSQHTAQRNRKPSTTENV